MLDHRQRAFARGIAEGKSWSDAQIAAGYRPNRKNKNLLLRDERVLAEIERIRDVIERERYRVLAEMFLAEGKDRR
jgi:phage terminase small subunit